MPKKNTKFGSSAPLLQHSPYGPQGHAMRRQMGFRMPQNVSAYTPKTPLQWFRVFAEVVGFIAFVILIGHFLGWGILESVCEQTGGCGSPCGSPPPPCGSPEPCEPCLSGSVEGS